MAASSRKFTREMHNLATIEPDASQACAALEPALVPRPTESGVFVSSQRAIDIEEERPSLAVLDHASEEVTLVVYGWENVQPGTLSWVFPSLRAALQAVRAMRNAVRWAVVLGDEPDDVDTARETGRVLVEA